MADFRTAIDKVLKNEGGLLDPTPGVNGDETNFGIDEKHFPEIEVEQMTKGQARDFYYGQFWTPMRLFFLSNQEITDQLLDCGVNCGKKTAIKIAQKAYNDLYPQRPLVVDGVMGPKTVLALNELKYPKSYLNALVYHRVRYYLEVLAAKPEKEPNRVGWLNRI